MRTSVRAPVRTLVVATMHGKEHVIGPVVSPALGDPDVVVPEGFDTDRFGTFTREVPRPTDQVGTARAKAAAALDATGCDLGIASEGAFGPHPEVGFVALDVELVLLLDRASGHEVHGWHRTVETTMQSRHVTSVAEALRFAGEVGFPDNGLVLRRGPDDPASIEKDLADCDALVGEVGRRLRRDGPRGVYLEADLRAHRNALRRVAIRRAAEALVVNLRSPCPSCRAPGFALTTLEPGLRCRMCGTPTTQPQAEHWSCRHCEHQELRPVDSSSMADPARCDVCNP